MSRAQMLTEIALPLLFAAIDSLMCLLDYFKPSSWNEQLECDHTHTFKHTHAHTHAHARLLLRCVEETCFKGPDAAADLLAFFSMPVVLGRFAAIMDATLNSRSGKRFFKAPSSGSVSSKGRTRNPETNQAIDNKEPESAGMGNPMYNFDFAGAWEDFIGTTGADECAKCFVCKARQSHEFVEEPQRQPLFFPQPGAGAALRLVARGLHWQPLLAVQLCNVRRQRDGQLPDQWQLLH